MEINKTCCFFGHRKIKQTQSMRKKLYDTIEHLIVVHKVDCFLFGSKSQFDTLCYETVSDIKSRFDDIKRIYVRAEFPNTDTAYNNYLLSRYEDTFYPPEIIKAGKAVYVERNFLMIDKSKFCVVYYNNQYVPIKRKPGNSALPERSSKSGTKIALDYAISKNKAVFNVY